MREKKIDFRKWWWVFVVCGVGVIAVIILLITLHKTSTYDDYGLPIFDIKLNGFSIEDVNSDKDIKYSNNELVYHYLNEEEKYKNVEIKGRGNGTWLQEKKSYRIKFDEKIDLLGMGKAKKWILLANASDPTNLRNATAFYLESMLNMQPSLNGEYVELYVNGEYLGLYYLTHFIDIDKRVVDLKDPMGILVELDNFYGELENHYKTRNNNMLVVKDSVSKDNSDEAIKEFLKDFNLLEKAIEEKEYSNIIDIIDVESFAKYFILSEFTVNPDAYLTSFYFYKNGIDDKIHAGPGWDFDIAFGNKAWPNWLGERIYSPTETMIRKEELKLINNNESGDIGEWVDISNKQSKIMYDLMDMPEYVEEVKRVFNENLVGREEEIIYFIDGQSEIIRRASIRDGEKWNIFSYDEEIRNLIEWVKKRYRYLETIYKYS